MKTLKASGQIAYAFENVPEVRDEKSGPITVHTVQFRSFEISIEDFEAMTFEMLDVNSKEVATIAKLAEHAD